MKKFCAILVAVLMVTMMFSVAFAASVSASYNASTGVLSYKVSGLAEGERAEIYLGSRYIDTVSYDRPSGSQHLSLQPGSYTVSSSAGGSDSFTVGAPATDTPAPATDTPAPATNTPAPATNTPAPATATPAPSTDDDDEVPKTGDSATASYLMGGAMVLAAAYLLLRRRVHSK